MLRCDALDTGIFRLIAFLTEIMNTKWEKRTEGCGVPASSKLGSKTSAVRYSDHIRLIRE
jgi:hypothetical protein